MGAPAGRRNVVWQTPTVTADGLKLFACGTMLIQTVGIAVIENGVIDIGRFTQAELSAALAEDSRLMMWAGVGSVMQLLGGLAIPLFAFLLTEGFFHTSSVWKYLLRFLVCAAVSEVPYDLAVSGVLLDFSTQNAMVSMTVCLLMLCCLRAADAGGGRQRAGVSAEASQEGQQAEAFAGASQAGQRADAFAGASQAGQRAEASADAGGGGRLAAAAVRGFIVLGAVLWVTLLRAQYGLCLVLLTAVFYLFYARNVLKTVLGILISLMYVTGPLAFYGIWCYNGERKDRIPGKLYYVFYPLQLLVSGLIGTLL